MLSPKIIDKKNRKELAMEELTCLSINLFSDMAQQS